MERVGKGRPRIDAKKREDREFIDALRAFLGLDPLYNQLEDNPIAESEAATEIVKKSSRGTNDYYQ